MVCLDGAKLSTFNGMMLHIEVAYMNILFWLGIGVVVGWASCIGTLIVIAWLIDRSRRKEAKAA